MDTTPARLTAADKLVAKLTEKQAAALDALSASRFHTAHDLGVSARSLGSLVDAGLADHRWNVSSLRGGDHWSYRITGRGVVVLRKIAKTTNDNGPTSNGK